MELRAMNLLVQVKGTPGEAQAAARANGIHRSAVVKLLPGRVMLSVGMAYLGEVAQWVAATGATVGPLQAGDALCYQDGCAVTAPAMPCHH